MKRLHVMLLSCLFCLGAVLARGEQVACPAGQMSIVGTITNPPPETDPPSAYIDCRFYDAVGAVVEPDGFFFVYEYLGGMYAYPCLPLGSPDGAPVGAVEFDCTLAPLGSGEPFDVSPRVPVSEGTKTVDFVVDTGGSTTTTSSTQTTTTTTSEATTTTTTDGTTTTTADGTTTTTADGTTTTTADGTTTTTATTNTVAPSTVTSTSVTTTTTTLPPSCDDGDACTDDALGTLGRCEFLPKSGLAGVQCLCDRAAPEACAGQVIPVKVAKPSGLVCTTLRKITAATSAKKLRRLVGVVTRANQKANRAAQKSVTKQLLTTACGEALQVRLSAIRNGARGLLTP